ncbi:MAG: glycine--tRNA ligase subunit beta [Dethiosulfovibrio peptidovorans]|nr:MAG: glycine--tRNA ligase subunit beta [Dethiosulfovibrio peptidovorans]
MKTRNLILEIGTEEIPSRFMAQALADLRNLACSELDEARIPYGSVETYGTPRRLVLSVKEVAPLQNDLTESFKGPAWSNAFDGSGTPTRAAVGFAKSKGIDVDELERRDVNGVPYVFAEVNKKGGETDRILPGILPRIVDRLVFPKNMYWRKPSVRFARPIRWILCLLDDQIVPFELNGISSGDRTRGHRFMGAPWLAVPKESMYMEKLFDNYVVVDQEKRKEKMLAAISVIEKEMDGSVDLDPDLVQENLYLVEFPVPFFGTFHKRYLELPEEVLITTMKHHQKYFPVRDHSGKLMPCFVGVSNNRAVNMKVIQEGNQRVLRARLEDAAFFWKEDRKTPLSSKINRLKTVVYQEKLGSVYDKVMATVSLARELCVHLGQEDIVRLVERAATLSKSDLVTNMVYEFPELQGIIGREYARSDGEDPRVALAICEQYLPRSAGGELPTDIVGAIVGLSERIYSMVGAFKMGFRPSGSQDPYGLRRAARCINEILWGLDMDVNLDRFLAQAGTLLGLDEDPMGELVSFARQRLLMQLKEKGYSHELAELAVSVTGGRPLQAMRLLKALDEVRGLDWFANLVTAAVRVQNILSKSDDPTGSTVDEALLKGDQERALFAAVIACEDQTSQAVRKDDWSSLMTALAGLSPAITSFFEDVMVMDDDPEVRSNRLALLGRCDLLFQEVGNLGRMKR